MRTDFHHYSRRPLGNNLRLLREARGESVRAVAEAVGINPGDLSRIEREQRGCGDELKLALARHFGQPVSRVFFQAVERAG